MKGVKYQRTTVIHILVNRVFSFFLVSLQK